VNAVVSRREAYDIRRSETSVADSLGRDADSDPAKWETGFVGQLRPYRGSLNEENFREVMEAIRVLAPEIASSKAIDRLLIADLWSLVWFPRMWAFPPHGMLRRNDLICGRELS
jgi:hypothetical protein